MMFGTQTLHDARPVSTLSRTPFFQEDNDNDDKKSSDNEAEKVDCLDLPVTSLLHERPMMGKLKMKTFFADNHAEGIVNGDVDGVAKYRMNGYVAACGSDELVPPVVVTMRKPGGRGSVEQRVNSWKAAKRKSPPPPPPQRMSSLLSDDEDCRTNEDVCNTENDVQNVKQRPKSEIVQRWFVQDHDNYISRSESTHVKNGFVGRSSLTNANISHNSRDLPSPDPNPSFDVNLYMVKPGVHHISKQSNNDTSASDRNSQLLQKPKIAEKPKIFPKNNAANTCPHQQSEMLKPEDNRKSMLSEIVPKLNNIFSTSDVNAPIPPPRRKHAKLKLQIAAKNSAPKTEILCDSQTQTLNTSETKRVTNSSMTFVECEKQPETRTSEQSKHMALLTSELKERHRKESFNDLTTMPKLTNGICASYGYDADISRSQSTSHGSRTVNEEPADCFPPSIFTPSNGATFSTISSIPPTQLDVNVPSNHSTSFSAHQLSRCDSVPQLIDEMLQNGIKIPPPSEFDHNSERSSEASYNFNGVYPNGRTSYNDDGLPSARPFHRSLPGPRSCGDLSVLVEDDYLPCDVSKVRPASSLIPSWCVERNGFSDFGGNIEMMLSDSSCSSDLEVSEETWQTKPVALWDNADVMEWCRENRFGQLQHLMMGSNIDGKKLLQLSGYDLIKLKVSSRSTRERFLEATRGLQCTSNMSSLTSHWNTQEYGNVSGTQTGVSSLLGSGYLTLPIAGSSSRASSQTNVSGERRSDTSVHSQVPLAKWNSEDVLNWLQSVSLDEFRDRFADKLQINRFDERELILSRLYALQHPAGPSLEHLIEQQKLPLSSSSSRSTDGVWASEHRHRPLGRESSDVERKMAAGSSNERYNDRRGGALPSLSCSCGRNSNANQYSHSVTSSTSGLYSHCSIPTQKSTSISPREVFIPHTKERRVAQTTRSSCESGQMDDDGHRLELLREVALLKESIKERDCNIENLESIVGAEAKENVSSLFAILSGRAACHVMCHELATSPTGPGFTVDCNEAGDWLVKCITDQTSPLKPGDRLLELDGVAVHRLQNTLAILQNIHGAFTAVVARQTDGCGVISAEEEERKEEDEEEALRNDLSLALLEVDSMEQENTELKLQLSRLKLSEGQVRKENEKIKQQLCDLQKKMCSIPLENGKDELHWLNKFLDSDRTPNENGRDTVVGSDDEVS